MSNKNGGNNKDFTLRESEENIAYPIGASDTRNIVQISMVLALLVWVPITFLASIFTSPKRTIVFLVGSVFIIAINLTGGFI